MPPAARISDMHTCPMVTGVVPHVGGPIFLGCFNVMIGFLPAARVGDMATLRWTSGCGRNGFVYLYDRFYASRPDGRPDGAWRSDFDGFSHGDDWLTKWRQFCVRPTE